MLELLNENREKRKALDVKIAEQEAALTRERDKAASKLMNTAGIETAEQLRDMICFAQLFKPVADAEDIDIDKFRKMIVLAKSQQKTKDGESPKVIQTQKPKNGASTKATQPQQIQNQNVKSEDGQNG